MAMPELGEKAPAFTLEDQSGKTVKLQEAENQIIVD